MDKIAAKIDSALGNDLLLHRIFTSLEDIIQVKLEEPSTSDRKLAELKLILDKCGDLDYAVAVHACSTVVSLTVKGLLSVEESLIALMATTSTAKHFGVLVDAVTSLLPLRHGARVNRHPYITLFEMQSDTWPYISQQLNCLIRSKSFDNDNEITLLALYILCCGYQESRSSLWGMLLGELNNSKERVIGNILLESLVWNQSTSLQRSSFHLTGIQQLCDYAIANNAEDLAVVTSIFLTSALHMAHLDCGFSIQHSVNMLKELDQQFSLWLEPIVILISHFILECHSNCYGPLLDLCFQLSSKNCSPYVWSMLQSAVLSIFAYSTRIEPAVIRIVESVPNQIRISGSPHRSHNPHFHLLARADIRIKSAVATADLASLLDEPESKESLLANLLCSSPMNDSIFLLYCGIFWHNSNPIVLDRIVQHVADVKRFAQPVLTLLLKKLTAPPSQINPQTKVAILHSLPKLAFDKTCVPGVLQTLEALSSAKEIQPLRLRLLTDLWIIQDRTYPYLEKMIMTDQSPANFEFQLAKAAAIEAVCSAKAEKHGADLLSQISELLNSSLGHNDNMNTSTIATMALKSLVTLCRAEVVDLKSVWDILAPKLTRDHRRAVVIGLCNLLALTPQLRVDCEEYELFIQQAISTLFQVSVKSDQSPEVATLALRALSGFRHQDFHLKSMPHNCKADLKIPSKYLPTKAEETAPLSAEDVLDHVPGVCWTKLMDMYSNEVLETGFRHLISTLVKEELTNMPAWIYRKAAMEVTRRNEPPNYNSSLKEDSVLAALVQYMLRICELSPDIRFRIKLILSILAGPFEKPLPPLDWSVLEPIVDQYDLRPEFLDVILPQVPHSFSAQSFADKTLSSEPAESPAASVVFRHLAAVSKVVKAKNVEEFVVRFFSQNREPQDWVQILERLHETLKNDETESIVPPEIRQVIADHVIPLVAVLPDETSGSFVECFARCFRYLDDGNVPVDPPASLARKYITVFCLAAGECSGPKSGLSYLQKALQMTAHLDGIDRNVLQLIQRSIETHCMSSKTSTEFLQQFMSYIHSVALKSRGSQNLSNLMDVFCMLVSTLSNSETFNQWQGTSSWHTFPLAVHRLVAHADWTHTRKSMLNWTLALMDMQRVAPLKSVKSALFDSLSALDATSDKEVFTRIISLKT